MEDASDASVPLYKYGSILHTVPPYFPMYALCSDQMGDHALGCAKHGDRIARHDQLRDVIFEAAASASLAPAREERHLLPGSAAVV